MQNILYQEAETGCPPGSVAAVSLLSAMMTWLSSETPRATSVSCCLIGHEHIESPERDPFAGKG